MTCGVNLSVTLISQGHGCQGFMNWIANIKISRGLGFSCHGAIPYGPLALTRPQAHEWLLRFLLPGRPPPSPSSSRPASTTPAPPPRLPSGTGGSDHAVILDLFPYPLSLSLSPLVPLLCASPLVALQF